MKRYLGFLQKGILIILLLGLTPNPAIATDLILEIQFSNSLTEETLVVVAAFSGLMPVFSTHVAAQESSTAVNITSINAGRYRLYMASPSDIYIKDFGFALNEDGSVVFDASPSLQQNGNTIIIQ